MGIYHSLGLAANHIGVQFFEVGIDDFFGILVSIISGDIGRHDRIVKSIEEFLLGIANDI